MCDASAGNEGRGMAMIVDVLLPKGIPQAVMLEAPTHPPHGAWT